jgi:sugar lactone lactonase YvrE
MKQLFTFGAAFVTAALLAACGSNNGLSSSAPVSVAPQIGAPFSAARSAPRRATSGDNLYVSNSDDDSGGSVTVYAPGSKKVLRTISQGVYDPQVIAFDSSGNLYVSNQTADTVTVYPSGGSEPELTISQGLSQPIGLALDSTGNLYVGDQYIPSDQLGRTVTVAPAVTVYAPGSGKLLRTITKDVCSPGPLAVDSSNDLYVGNTLGNPGPCHISSGGYVSVYASNSKRPVRKLTKGVAQPTALIFDGSGNLYVAGLGNNLVTVYAPGSKKVLRTYDDGINGPQVLAFDSSGNLYVGNGTSNNVTVYAAGSTTLLRTISQDVDGANGLALDASDNLYVANYYNSTVTVYASGGTKLLRTITSGVLYPDYLAFGP